MIYLCRTTCRETGETNTFLCSAPNIEKLSVYFCDEITELTDVFYQEEIEEVLLNQYDGLAILSTI